MAKFSLRQIFVAVVALAIGFSIWRLPKGSWVDIPLAALSFCFIVSLGRHAIATRQLLAAHPALPREQRWGGRVLMTLLFAAALGLILAIVCDFLIAAEISLKQPDFVFDYMHFPSLARSLAVLTMLVAVGLGVWQGRTRESIPLRKKVYAALAVGGTLLAVLLYWADRLFIWYLVYLAVSGVESAQPPGWLPRDVDMNTTVRTHRFATASFAGVPLLVASLLLMTGLVGWWQKPRLRWLMAICLGTSLAAECSLACWFAIEGLWQLSPPFQQAIQIPPVAAVLIAAMVLFSVGAFSWRMFAQAAPFAPPSEVAVRKPFFHEHWLASLLLGLVAVGEVANSIIVQAIAVANSPIAGLSLDWQTLVQCVTQYPTQLIPLAATIGGFALAWTRWRRRNVPLDAGLPCIDPAIFATTMASLLIFAVASAPLVAAAGFSYWFVRLAG
jgi:hypothetical protein